jgi:tRNA pseudouridine(38-40) synthase
MPEADLVLIAIVGTGGLRPALAAIEAGKDIAVASKEILVMAGEVVMEAARRRGVRVLPVDSEHNAIFQCLDGRDTSSVRRLILTCSGGPFRQTPSAELENVTPEMALRHPTWNMGKKITIDSATLFNKALEMIEARWLFDIGIERVDVVVHPQSIVHSMVEFVDGSVLAQLGLSDMRLPIQYAVTWPDRVANSLPPLDLAALQTAADVLVGQHDFAAFCRRAPGRTTTRRIEQLSLRRIGPGPGRIDIRLRGPAFCHQQVRSIVGCLVDVGRGKRPERWIADVLASGDRSLASPVAPPHGLTLERVHFGRGIAASPPPGSDPSAG